MILRVGQWALLMCDCYAPWWLHVQQHSRIYRFFDSLFNELNYHVWKVVLQTNEEYTESYSFCVLLPVGCLWAYINPQEYGIMLHMCSGPWPNTITPGMNCWIWQIDTSHQSHLITVWGEYVNWACLRGSPLPVGMSAFWTSAQVMRLSSSSRTMILNCTVTASCIAAQLVKKWSLSKPRPWIYPTCIEGIY